MLPTRNDLPLSVREPVAALLNARLADATDLFTQAKQAHWNVKGPSFIALHELFDTVAGQAAEYADDLAERVVQLGGVAIGTVRAAAAASRLKEYPLNASNTGEHVRALADALAAFGASIRAAIDECERLGDKDAADLCTGISRSVDKHLWFVDSHLAG